MTLKRTLREAQGAWLARCLMPWMRALVMGGKSE